MHAYLLIGTNVHALRGRIAAIIKNHDIKDKREVVLSKISDVRDLKLEAKLTKSVAAAYIADISAISREASNALLKTLEEPGEMTYFILHSASKAHLTATVLSRALVEHLPGPRKTKTTKFLGLSRGGQFETISNIKTREDALKLVENIAASAHKELLSGRDAALVLEKAISCHSAISANANIQIQLTDLVVSLRNKG